MKEKTKIKIEILIIAIIVSLLVAIGLSLAKYIFTDSNEVLLQFYEYRISQDDINIFNKDNICLSTNDYTKDEVTVEITTEEPGLSIQYKLENSENWNDYTEKIIVTENTKLETRLVAKDLDGNLTFSGPITEKDITNISVAKIENTYYRTLEKAIQACPENAGDSQTKIEMLLDVEESVTVSETQNIVLDLNGKTVTGVNGSTITNNGILTISGESGTITGFGADTITNAGTLVKDTEAKIENTSTVDYYVINNRGIVNISKGTIVGSWRGIANYEYGKITISGGTLTAGATVIRNYGNANEETSPAVKISGNPILESTKSNTIVNDVLVTGLIYIDGGTINSTNAEASTPTVINNGNGKVLITKGTIKCSGTNAVVYNGNNNGNGEGTVEIRGGTIESDTANGVTNNEKGNVKISGGKINGVIGVRNNSLGTVNVSGDVEIIGTNGSGITNLQTGTINVSGTAYIEGKVNHGITNGAQGTINVTGTPTIIGATMGIRGYVGTINVSGGTIIGGKDGINVTSAEISNTIFSGSASVTGGTIIGGRIGIIAGSGNASITLGKKGENVSLESPVIISTNTSTEVGHGCGIYLEQREGSGNATLYFYDGIIYAQTQELTISGNATEVEPNYQIVYGTKEYEGTMYKTAYLGNEVVFDFNTANNMNKWDYFYATRFNVTYNSSTRMNDISFTGASGFELISIPIQTVAGNTYKISFDYKNNIVYTGLDYQGIKHEGIMYQVLNAAPKGNANFDISIQYKYLPTELTEGRYELEFEATGEISYLVINFGSATDNIPINVNLGNFVISKVIEQGQQLGPLPSLTLSETTFNGYYTARTGGNAISATTTVGTNPGTYYAQITQNNNYQNIRTNEYYATMVEAFRSASSEDTVRVINGITETKSSGIVSGKTLTLETTSGKTTTLKGVTLTNNGTLTISGAGTLTTSSAVNLITNAGTLNLANTGTISNTNTGAYRTITNTGTVNKTGSGTVSSAGTNSTIGGGTIKISGGTVSTSGGLAINTSGTFNMSNGTVTSSYAEAVFLTGASATVSGGTITKGPDLAGTNHTGSTFVYSGTGTAIISGGTIQTLEGSGSATVNKGNSTGVIEIKGTATINNLGSGYAVVNNNSTQDKSKIVISSGTITANTGYAVNNNYSGAVEINGGTITANTKYAVNNAGVGTIEINGGTITSARSVAVRNSGTGSITISNGTISTTESMISGGANPDAVVNGSTGTLTISGGNIKSANNAGVSIGNGTVTITGGTIEGKTYGIWTSTENTTTVTVGTDDSSVSINNPSITGKTKEGFHVGNGTFNFYDGIIRGPSGNSINGTVSKIPTGYTVMKGTEEIDGITYETSVLSAEYVTNGVVTRLDATNNNGGSHSSDTTTWKALSGTNGTITNGTWGDNYLEFDGSTSWVNLGEMNSDYQSLEVTFLADKTVNQSILGNWETGGGGIYISERRIRGQYYINNSYITLDSNIYITAGTVYNVQFTYDGTTLILYVNGTNVVSQSVSGTIGLTKNSTVMAIGVNPKGDTTADGKWLDGKIYTASVYNRALTEDEVKQNAIAGFAVAGGQMPDITAVANSISDFSSQEVMINDLDVGYNMVDIEQNNLESEAVEEETKETDKDIESSKDETQINDNNSKAGEYNEKNNIEGSTENNIKEADIENSIENNNKEADIKNNIEDKIKEEKAIEEGNSEVLEPSNILENVCNESKDTPYATINKTNEDVAQSNNTQESNTDQPNNNSIELQEEIVKEDIIAEEKISIYINLVKMRLGKNIIC